MGLAVIPDLQEVHKLEQSTLVIGRAATLVVTTMFMYHSWTAVVPVHMFLQQLTLRLVTIPIPRHPVAVIQIAAVVARVVALAVAVLAAVVAVAVAKEIT